LPATQETIVAQVTAITKWGMAPKPASLDSIRQPVLVANGDTDVMVPSINSVELARKLPQAELSIFPDAGHGAIFQYHSAFLDQTLRFLPELTLMRHCRVIGKRVRTDCQGGTI